MTDYRVLVVAPATDLQQAGHEAAAVVNVLQAKLLQGHVTIDSVLNMVKQGGWDILWFSTHGSESGVLLSDGHLTASQLTTIVRTSGAWLTVLNTCNSLSVAFRLHNELLTDFLCTVRETPDQEAYLTATQFAIQLSRGLDPYDAYLAAKPGQNNNYLYLVGIERGVRHMDRKAEQSPPSDGKELAAIWAELNRISTILDGDPRWGPGLRNILAETRKEWDLSLKELDKRMSRFEKAVSAMTITVILLGVLCFFLLLITGALVFLR